VTSSVDDAEVSRRFDEILRSRRTIGTFRPEPPPRDVILSAVEIATWAPNHRKTEPWRFTWLGPAAVRLIIELNAELVAAKKGPEEAAKKRRQWTAVPGWLAGHMPEVVRSDATRRRLCRLLLCDSNLMLSLWSRGIGTKWSTGSVTQHAQFAEISRFDPQAERVVGLIWYGYPNVIPDQTRKPPTDVLRETP